MVDRRTKMRSRNENTAIEPIDEKRRRTDRWFYRYLIEYNIPGKEAFVKLFVGIMKKLNNLRDESI